MSLRRLLLLLAVSFAAALPLRAQDQPGSRPPLVWIDPAQGTLQPIALEQATLDIRVQGFVASTRIDLTFFNPNARVLEGELVFPLATGQSVTGYALEVEGKLREGVVVEKETARVAFESTVRRGIDPGLAELTRGNVFRTRLYPIPANGRKRVVVAFDQPLLDRGDAYRYVLPLAFAQRIGRFAVHVEAVRAEHAPTVAAGDPGLSFQRARDSFIADLEQRDFTPRAELAFDLPKAGAPVTAFAVPDALEPAWRTFAAQVQSAPPANLKPAPAPRRIVLFYDASGSAARRDRVREFAFLDAWWRKLVDVDVQLVAFRNDADRPRPFAIRGGDGSGLRHALETLPLDGGSSYGAIALPAGSSPDLVLVLGDGLSNFGAHGPRLDGVPRLVLAHAAQTADAAALARIARRHGGSLVNLLETDAAQALLQIDAPRWMLQRTRVVSGQCEALTPAAPQPVAASLALYGRCRGAATLELAFGQAGGTPLLRTVRIDDATLLDPTRGSFVARLWATSRIADLEAEARPDDAAITALAKRHGVVTRNTSMLVLDRIEDYVQYRVEPREPELAAQYRELLAAQAKNAPVDLQRQQHLNRVLAQWREFRAYHETRHPWLETVLVPMAEREAAAWLTPAATKERDAGRAASQALAKQAKGLQQRWLREGAGDASRAAWEREAVQLVMQLDALAKQRERLPLHDVSGKQAGGPAITGTAASFDAPRPVAEPAPAPPASPAPALAAPAESVAADVAEGDLERVVVTGSRARSAPEPEMAERKVAADDGAATPVATSASIELAPWNPQTPYLAALRAAQDPYAAYLVERESQALTPAFFLDCADYFRIERKDSRLALRILSNLAEIDFESAPLLRVLAYRLQQWQRFELAVPLFEEVLLLRGEEPQSRRDLALALSRQPQPEWARATDLLWDVTSRSWDGRFPDIQLIALHELNDVLMRMPLATRTVQSARLIAAGVDAAFLQPVPVELRVVLSWDADNTDIDLWVIDPSGDTAIYSQPRTRTGGHMSRDFTGGYGPEVFTIRRALPGTYVVKAHYFGDRQQELTGATTVQAEFLTGFNSGDSQRVAVTRRLEGDEDQLEIGRFTIEAK